MNTEKMTRREYHDALGQQLDAIKTREDLADFLDFLLWGYEQDFIEQQPVEEYLSGAANFTRSLHNYCKNFNLQYPEQPDWRWLGEIFTAAFGHS